MLKNPPADAGATGSIPGWGRSPGGGHGNSLQHSCLEDPRDRGAWWATVHGVTQSQTRPKRLSMAIMRVVLLKELVLELGLREELLLPQKAGY